MDDILTKIIVEMVERRTLEPPTKVERPQGPIDFAPLEYEDGSIRTVDEILEDWIETLQDIRARTTPTGTRKATLAGDKMISLSYYACAWHDFVWRLAYDNHERACLVGEDIFAG